MEAADYRTLVTDKSPAYTQDRMLATSRFWRLDPGRYEAELWFNQRYFKGGTSSDGLLQAEIEIGIAPHLQLDIYQNFNLNTEDTGAFGWGGTEGTQIELRYAFANKYDEIALNPVLYLEWHPRRGQPDRAEVKLLLGGDITPSLLGVVNLYAEANANTLPGQPGNSMKSADMELGGTVSVSYAVDIDHFRIGAEAKLGIDQHGNDKDPTDPEKFYPVGLVGPNIMLKWPEQLIKLTATCLFGVAQYDPKVYPYVILGKLW
jgi:hypothetical protein